MGTIYIIFNGLVSGKICEETPKDLYLVVKKKTWFPVDFPLKQSIDTILDDTLWKFNMAVIAVENHHSFVINKWAMPLHLPGRCCRRVSPEIDPRNFRFHVKFRCKPRILDV